MISVRESIRQVNDAHPLIAAPLAGAIGVTLSALVFQRQALTGLWAVFAAITLGAGLGQYAQLRGRA